MGGGKNLCEEFPGEPDHWKWAQGDVRRDRVVQAVAKRAPLGPGGPGGRLPQKEVGIGGKEKGGKRGGGVVAKEDKGFKRSFSGHKICGPFY